MGLSKLIGKTASHDELVVLLQDLEKENARLRSAIEWALGESGEFEPPHEYANAKKGKYWWRSILRIRAGL